MKHYVVKMLDENWDEHEGIDVPDGSSSSVAARKYAERFPDKFSYKWTEQERTVVVTLQRSTIMRAFVMLTETTVTVTVLPHQTRSLDDGGRVNGAL